MLKRDSRLASIHLEIIYVPLFQEFDEISLKQLLRVGTRILYLMLLSFYPRGYDSESGLCEKM